MTTHVSGVRVRAPDEPLPPEVLVDAHTDRAHPPEQIKPCTRGVPVDAMRLTDDTEAAYQRGRRAGYIEGYRAVRADEAQQPDGVTEVPRG